MQLHEHLCDRARQTLVEREALAAPVAGCAEPLQLADDRAAELVLPRPNPLEKFLATHGPSVGLLALEQLPLDHHLRRDAGMISAGLPEHVLAVHAPVAAQDVLQCVVERMAHMQVAGNVGRRNDDAERLRILSCSRAERARLFPERADASLHVRGLKCLVHHFYLSGGFGRVLEKTFRRKRRQFSKRRGSARRAAA